LPFAKDDKNKLALPVPLCDYQAIVGPAGQRWDLDAILAELGLVAWDFEYLVGLESLDFGSAFLKSRAAPRIDLRKGAEGYFEEMKAGDVSLKNLKLKRDKIQKKHGPLRFVIEADSKLILDRILDWKAQRFNDGRPLDPRVRNTLDSLVGTGPHGLKGLASGLYAGDERVAAHFGLVYGGVLHYWFPGFNPEFSRFTPGFLLVYDLITNLERMGASILDFGPGGEGYKQYFCNDELPIASGGIEIFSRFTLARKCRRQVETAVRSTRWLYEGMRPIVRGLRKLRSR
jgi:CelD/BcsL family acetyltransferase involved in cellulose biosynthesis